MPALTTVQPASPKVGSETDLANDVGHKVNVAKIVAAREQQAVDAIAQPREENRGENR